MQLRLPDELKRWLHHQAIDNRRALNSEILVRLEESRIAKDRQRLLGCVKSLWQRRYAPSDTLRGNVGFGANVNIMIDAGTTRHAAGQ